MKSKGLAIAASLALEDKYPGLELIKGNKELLWTSLIIPDKLKGFYTLAFPNKNDLRWEAIEFIS